MTQPTTPPTLLPVGALLAQLNALPLLGVDSAKVRAQLGDLPSQPDALVPVQQYLSMWSAAESLYGQTGLPTALGMAVPFGAFGAIDYLCGSAETVAGCLESLILHFAMVSSDTRLVHEQLNDGSHVIVVQAVLGELPVAALEFTLAVLISRLRYLTGNAFPLLRVGLPLSRPANDAVRNRLLAVPLVYEYPGSMLQFAASGWPQAIALSDPYLHASLIHMAAQLHLSQRGDSELERALRLRLRDALVQSEADPERMALLLGMSERTLQRRLGELGRSYSAVMEDFRRDEAMLLLADNKHAVAQVALQLGYAEQTSFTRAFRRWTGTTPKAWRIQRGV